MALPPALRACLGRPAALGLLAVGAYAIASLAVFGRGVIRSPGSTVVGDAGADKTIFLWSLEWWPHAISSGHDPFDANVVWVPHGIDLSWVTAAPLVSLVAWPLTALAGPIASYDVLALVAPALCAWSAYLLARWLTKAFWPSLTAGWIFGFSAFEIDHMAAHLNLVLVFFVPLAALLVLQHLNGELGSRRFVPLLALVLAGQFLISTEIFIDLLLVGALFALSDLVLSDGDGRKRLRATVAAVGWALVLALAVVSPYLWHAFVVSGPANAPVRSPFSTSADLLGSLVPAGHIWIQPSGVEAIAHRFTTSGGEPYLGVGLLAVVCLYATGARQPGSHRIVLAGLAAIVLASLGREIRAGGDGLLWGPWKILAKLPVTKALLPVRLSLFIVLVVAMIVARWLAERPSHHPSWRWALVLAGIVLVLPNPSTAIWSSQAPNPGFFRTSAYRAYLRRGDVALLLPFGAAGWSLLWQAEDGMSYRIVGGHFGRKVTPSESAWTAVYGELGTGPRPRSPTASFHRFLRAHHVDTIVVAPGTRHRVRHLVASLRLRPLRVDDVLVYRLH